MSLSGHRKFLPSRSPVIVLFFFFNDTATTEIYTLSLHDALPISWHRQSHCARLHRRDLLGPGKIGLRFGVAAATAWRDAPTGLDRKSTRLNSSHANISYAVFCLKKKKNTGSHAEPECGPPPNPSP